MPQINVTIKNLPQIRAAFSKAPIKMATELNTAIKKSIFTIERVSKINTPVLTGRLRASHESRFSNLRGELEPTANYAIWVHDGTRRMRARPFLLNAVQTVDEQVNDFFTKAVQNTLDDIGRQV